MTRLGVSLFAFLTYVWASGVSAAQELPKAPSGFMISKIAEVPGARELAVAPNGDLFAGTVGSEIYIVAHADTMPQRARIFTKVDDAPAAGVAIDANTIYIGGQFGIWRLHYSPGDFTARSAPRKIAHVRTSGTARDHLTTTVALAGGKLYASVGSSCDSCHPDLDATRATIQVMHPDGSQANPKAINIRNAIALAVNPVTGTLWAGNAGQDELAHGHPYEIFDAVGLHAGTADYGWPYCYENRRPTGPGHDCSRVVVPRVVFPAYETPIGAVFYPFHLKGRNVFPRSYWGGAFVTLHGSWHAPLIPPRVVFVPMNGDAPKRGVIWSDPNTQWIDFLSRFQYANGNRMARPTGIAVGPQGDLFVADDQGGAIYRIRPVR
ncbi:MAG: sorbosone dehydrogenase family protein [Candidatus Baltobacteraceae bacterium]